jgi:hypothetical protein
LSLYASEDFSGAPCTDPVYGPDLWSYRAPFYEDEREQRTRHNEAIRLCKECPWIQRCANLHREVGGDGVWGGRIYGHGSARRHDYEESK